MKVLRLHGSMDLRLHDEQCPTAGVDEKLLDIKAVGSVDRICIGLLKVELAMQNWSTLWCWVTNLPGSPGGQRVAVEPAISCRKCEYCLGGNPNLCEQVIFAGHGTQDGALREQIAWDEHNLFPLPEPLTYADGAMLEPLGGSHPCVDLAGKSAG